MITTLIIVIALVMVILVLKPRSKDARKVKQRDITLQKLETEKETNGRMHLQIDVDCDNSRTMKRVESKLAWLKDRWKVAFDQRDNNMNCELFDDWYFDSPTEAQINRLKEDGVIVKSGGLTKGQYSDLIGILTEPEEEELAIVKFFGGKTRGLSGAEARSEVRALLSAEDNKTAWQNRPASARQKRFLKFMGEKIPKGLTHANAEKIQDQYFLKFYDSYSEYLESLSEEEAEMPLEQWTKKHIALNDWEYYEQILDEFDDSDFRDTYGIKKVPAGQLNKAIEQLKGKGIALSEMVDDLDLVTEVCIDNNPSLERE